MRIIAGQHRSRLIVGPADAEVTRPITDRVKENLFNRLVSLGAVPNLDFHGHKGSDAPDPPEDSSRNAGGTSEGAGEISGGAEETSGGGGVLDLFCGTGSLGLEALSRGNRTCVFMDTDRDAIGRLRENLAALDLDDRATVRAESVLSPLWVRTVADGAIAVAFVDPPYKLAEEAPTRDRLARLFESLVGKLEPGGVIVYRTPVDVEALPLNEAQAEAAGYDGPVSFDYGAMSLHLYQRPLPADAG